MINHSFTKFYTDILQYLVYVCWVVVGVYNVFFCSLLLFLASKPVTLKKVSLPRKATFQQIKKKTLKACDKACHQHLECNSYQYNTASKLCDLSNVTQFNDVAKPTTGNWDLHFIKPG